MIPKPSDADLLVGAQPKRMRAEHYLDPRIFRSLLKLNPTTGCQEWSRTRLSGGYGCFPKNKKTYLAHRQAWEMVNGPIPDDLEICHTCDNPPCCNTAHMFLGTQADNLRDMQRKGRASGGAQGERHNQAKLTEEQVREIRSLYRPSPKGRKSPHSANSIGQRFGVSKSTVLRIVTDRLWAHI